MIKIMVKGQELTLAEAKELYNELAQLFNTYHYPKYYPFHYNGGTVSVTGGEGTVKVSTDSTAGGIGGPSYSLSASDAVTNGYIFRSSSV